MDLSSEDFMRPYKVVIGCTRYLPSITGHESINFQLYSQHDYKLLKLRVHQIFSQITEKPQEDLNNKPDPNIPTDPPEVYSTSISLPYINYSIRIKESEIKKLKQLIEDVFPKKYYIEVQ